MIFLFTMLTFSALMRVLILLITSAESPFDLSGHCLAILPENSAHQMALGSLLCGRKVTDPDLLEGLRQTSLLHLFVVSGSHLIVIENLLQRCKVTWWLRRMAGCGFIFLSGAQAPVVRAFIGLCLPRERSRWGPRSRPDLDVLKAGALTLALIPPWIHSLSLALSWAAAFALSLPLGTGARGACQRAVMVWMCVAPLLAPWGVPDPLSWILNLFIAPVFATLSVPLAILALLDGPFVGPFDLFMDGFIRLIQKLSGPAQTSAMGAALPAPVVWTWIGGLHVTAHALLMARVQRKIACAS